MKRRRKRNIIHKGVPFGRWKILYLSIKGNTNTVCYYGPDGISEGEMVSYGE